MSQALETLRSKNASDLIDVKEEDASIAPSSTEVGEGEEGAATAHRRGRKKSKTAETTDDEVKSGTKASEPVQISPAGRPIRAKAGQNKHLEM